MGKEQPKKWWETVPGIITAITGLFVAITGLISVLSSVGFINRASAPEPKTAARPPEPGPLPEPKRGNPEQPSKPEPPKPEPSKPEPSKPEPSKPEPSKPEPKPEEPPKPDLEYASYFELKYGYSVIYPKTLLFQKKEDALGRRFESIDGKVSMSVNHFENPERLTAAQSYAEAIDALTKHTPEKIVDQRLEGNAFEFTSRNGLRISHNKYVFFDKYFRFLGMQYDESESPVFDAVWTRIATHFGK